MKKEILTMYNGNKQRYKKGLPKIHILGWINDVALAWIEKQTGLKLKEAGLGGYVAQPTRSQQITKLFLTYNFMTKYYNNGTIENTIFLKTCHDQDWDNRGAK
ncbi:MAG: hypothetical protein KAW52_00390 [candidate division Zixibacteria bacterium]|nr:hypothetical protein [candidate division Zixibacteria bacterium]